MSSSAVCERRGRGRATETAETTSAARRLGGASERAARTWRDRGSVSRHCSTPDSTSAATREPSARGAAAPGPALQTLGSSPSALERLTMRRRKSAPWRGAMRPPPCASEPPMTRSFTAATGSARTAARTAAAVACTRGGGGRGGVTARAPAAAVAPTAQRRAHLHAGDGVGGQARESPALPREAPPQAQGRVSQQLAPPVLEALLLLRAVTAQRRDLHTHHLTPGQGGGQGV